jgi:hypothetical protein
MIILPLILWMFRGIYLLMTIVLLNVHSIYILILVTTNMILIFGCSLFTMSVILNHLFEISDLIGWTIVVLSRILLGKALDLWSGTYLRNVWFLGATSLLIWSASSCMSSFYKLWHLIFLLIKIFQHLRSRHLWSLSCFSKNLWSTFDHLLNWILSLFLILRLVVLLIRIWLRNIVSELGTVMMSMKVRLRIASFFLNWVMNFTNELIALMCSKAFVLNHASLVAVVVTHDSRWVYHNSFGLLLSGSRS